MQKTILLLAAFLTTIISGELNAQTIELGCSGHTDAFIGLDRKDWNNGSTEIHSEGMHHNFVVPEDLDCKKITQVDISVSVSLVDDSGLSGDCGAIQYFVNIYSGCGSFEPASCPESNLVAEPNSPNFNSQNYSFDSNDFDFQLSDTLGVDIIPAIGNPACNNGQSAISSGDIVLEYEICVEISLEDLEMTQNLDIASEFVVCEGVNALVDAGDGFETYDWSPTGDTTQIVELKRFSYRLKSSE